MHRTACQSESRAGLAVNYLHCSVVLYIPSLTADTAVVTAGAATEHCSVHIVCAVCAHGVKVIVVLSVCSDTFPNNDTMECEQCHDECIGCCNQVSACICVPVSVCHSVYEFMHAYAR